ncbi:RNI-like protein [Melanomma pulvis-pyrius CBS 109.77]|uniref:RNI-like protein n=1 Tax=Melanomma pulvis-pyrius CBS 109.77 TaxID=1314802 RepID=A0A6A6XFL6_9PLEO|nr:RNI-like protein [Melanomma pulvis-pyrius CBS 109.77]
MSDLEKPSLAQAVQWADKIRNVLLVVAPYDESEDSKLPMSINIDESIMEAPRRRSANPVIAALANHVAQLLYPSPDNSLGSLIKYDKDIIKLRRYVLQQRKRAIEIATKRNDMLNLHKRIIAQGAWDPAVDPLSLNGTPSLPMPVKIADPETLAPFFEHIQLDGTEDISSSARATEDSIEVEEPYYGTKALEFQKGVLYADHRMDLCKMVLGPQNIGDLIESLKTNTFITHFLLGNNIIGPHGAKCIAEFLKEFPNRIDTWYLAGNCIDTPSFSLLVDEWVRSTSVTNIWLKRNPLGPTSAADVFKLISQTPHLRTLDLDQTELGDAGVAELFSRLASHYTETPLPLRHLYLNGVGIGVKAATAIGKYLATAHCALHSLYLTNNPIGSDGITALAEGLKQNKSLARLTLASVGMSDDGAVSLCEALYDHANIVALDIGQSLATLDLGSRYNWITDRSAYGIHNLIISSKLEYLNLGKCALNDTGINLILGAILQSPTFLFFNGKTIWSQSKAAVAVAASQEHVHLAKCVAAKLRSNVKRMHGPDVTYAAFMDREKRWLINDKTDVRKIDSVYRNRDSRLARRGLMKLDKFWDEDDETLKEVMESAVGPVCTRRLNAVGPTCSIRKNHALAVDL